MTPSPFGALPGIRALMSLPLVPPAAGTLGHLDPSGVE